MIPRMDANPLSATTDYLRIEKAIQYLEARFREQPDLASVARHVGLSEFHFQRLFRRWAGVTPKRFLQFITADHARALLRSSRGVLDAAFQSGLSGSGRLHDLMVTIHAATPGEVQRQGEGLTIGYSIHATPFGDCLIALSRRGVCALSFVHDTDQAKAIEALRQQWPRAELRRAEKETAAVLRRIMKPNDRDRPIDLYVAGSNLQIKVWEALVRIPPGAIASYQDLARAAGRTKAVRAVASAVAQNPVALLIPCHRVIRKSGAFGEYHWGTARKKAILAWEAAHLTPGLDEP